jgi:hypothetical protein
MKKLLVLLSFSLCIVLLSALPVGREEAVRLAAQWMNQFSSSAAVAEVIPVSSLGSASVTDFYVINFQPGGFVLFSAEDTAVPVLGYDTANRFGTTGQPANLAWFIQSYQEELSLLRNQPTVQTHPLWQEIRRGDFSSFQPTRPVSPLLQTTWDQSWPYNSLCPSDASGSGGHALAGCGATAMGQIMKYWQYPAQGIGSHSYSHPTYGIISANFGATTYNYASMPNSLWFTPNTAISTLLFHCGVALEMDYGPDGSGSYVNDVRPAFVNYFGYETTAQAVYKNAYTNTNWDTLMRTELDASRPIFYFGTDVNQGGHAWVCDGYSGTNYFHMNWGWSGSSNGYFYLSNLNPAGYAFNSNQGAVIGLRPTAPIAPPTNLTATVDTGNNIFLEWQSPLSRALLGYTIYRDGAQLISVPDPLTTTYFDINLTAGTYSYYVIANFSQGDSQPSNTVVATVYPAPVINYQESFELFSNFETDLFPWFSYDLDTASTLQLDFTDFPGEGATGSFMVFNPAAAVPPVPELAAFNYNKLLISFPPEAENADDWFCSPKWNTGNQAKMRFWARSAYADSGLAKIYVGVSTSTPDPQNMTVFSGIQPLQVPTEWTLYEYTLTNHTFSNVFIGVHNVTDSGALLLLDRFQLWSSYVGNEDDHSTPQPGLELKAYPNPFGAVTHLAWEQKTPGPASLQIFDLKGRLINTLQQVAKTSGTQTLDWNGSDHSGKPVANGIYFCRLSDPSGNSRTVKLVYVK